MQRLRCTANGIGVRVSLFSQAVQIDVLAVFSHRHGPLITDKNSPRRLEDRIIEMLPDYSTVSQFLGRAVRARKSGCTCAVPKRERELIKTIWSFSGFVLEDPHERRERIVTQKDYR